jgi:hypothetical protein
MPLLEPVINATLPVKSNNVLAMQPLLFCASKRSFLATPSKPKSHGNC